MAMEVAFGTGMLIGWMRVRYVPHDEGDGTGSENVHDDIQRSHSLLTLVTLSTKQDRSLTELDCRNGHTTFYCVSPVAAIILSCPEQGLAASIVTTPPGGIPTEPPTRKPGLRMAEPLFRAREARGFHR